MNGWAKGMDTRREEFDLERDALRNVVNADILTSGRIRMRFGPQQRIASAGAHSVATDGTKLYWATANLLRTASPTNLVASTLLTDARLAKPLSWLTLNGLTYFSNEDLNGLVNASGAYEAWGVVPPAVAPAVTGNGGSRFIMVTCAFVTAAKTGETYGEESGAPLGVAAAVSDAPSVLVTGIPQSTDARVVATRIYATMLDGTEFYRQIDVPAGVTSVTLQGNFGVGQPLRTQFMTNPPPGQLLEHHHGSNYIAAGNVLWHTVDLRYNLYDPAARFFMFPERITMIKAVPQGQARGERAGMFVAADRTYFIAGIGTQTPEIAPVLDYKAIEGASMHIPETDEVVWLSERGVVRGKSGGVVTNLTEGRIAMDKYTRAAMGILERDGHRALVVVGQSAIATPLLSTDWVADEAERLAEVQ